MSLADSMRREVIAVLPFHQGAAELSLLDTEGQAAVTRVLSHFLATSDPQPIDLRQFGSSDFTALINTGYEKPANEEPRYFPRLGLIVGSVDAGGLDKIRKDDAVSEVHPAADVELIDSVELLDGTPEQSWSIPALMIPEIWGRGITGKEVLVGHLDSGVFREHPALTLAIEALATIDSDGQFVEAASSNDTHGHGTHTAGIICGRPNGSALVGIAPDARLVSANIIQGDRPRLQLLSGLEWLLSRQIRILALSVGIEPYNPVYQVIINRLREAGVLPIAAIGNASVGTSYSPANYQNTIGVGSMERDQSVAVLSSSDSLTGPPPYSKPDLIAPGGRILSTSRAGGYELRSGTSQAAPCVAGIAALLMEAKPQAGIDEIEQAIFTSCRSLNNVPAARQGRGVIDPIAALERL